MPDTLLNRLAKRAWQRRNPDFSLDPPPGQELPDFDLPLSRLPRYLAAQAQLAMARRRDGIEGQPWITAESRLLLGRLLKPTDLGFEFGAGGSTEWFAARVARLYSVDGVDRWHDALADRLSRHHVSNVALELASGDKLGHGSTEHREAYVGAHPEVEPQSVDFVFIDGEYREACAIRGIELLRPGGLFIVDNANQYLPSPTDVPWKVQRPATQGWADVAKILADWRCAWTTNGVWDTTIWWKPACPDGHASG